MKSIFVGTALLVGLGAHSVAMAQPSNESAHGPDSPAPKSDVDMIPPEIVTPGDTIAQPVDASTVFFVQNALTISAFNDDQVASIPGFVPQSEVNRTSADLRGSWEQDEGWEFHYSARLNVYIADRPAFDVGHDVRLDLREAYETWSASNEFFIDAGRINVRNGVAYGFNPTDYFSRDAVVERDSQDPSVLRSGRLGAAMLRAQAVWDEGSVTAIYAPRIRRARSLFSDDRDGFALGFDRTNSDERWEVSATLNLADGLAPQLVAYGDRDRWKLGVNATYGLGKSTILYAEWSGAREWSVAEAAYRDGVKRQVLQAGTPRLFANAIERRFQTSLAAGLSYTFPFSVTTQVEYDYNEGGFGQEQLDRWFSLAQSSSGSVPALTQLWLIPNYALNTNQPWTQHELFVRGTWSNAMVRDLTISGLARVSLVDGSSLEQVSFEYDLNGEWTINARGSVWFGGESSAYGTSPRTASALFGLTKYF